MIDANGADAAALARLQQTLADLFVSVVPCGIHPLLTRRFTGSVEPFARVNVAEIVGWISAIDLRDWPQQSLGEMKPAMVNDPGWFGFAARTRSLVEKLLGFFPGCEAFNPLLSVVMPGHRIEPHRDLQADYWLCRVHVPLMTNPQSRFIVSGIDYHLEVGAAYRVNTLAMHAVENDGPTPRIHLMVDVGAT